ncbi:hypothetical protein [Tolypothrix sp. NIES-4075]|uniref:hypothetical protein n=1 Tax=Tolypothrix sp. NIES-4075 TaxID=2005459 RepID=UPI001357CAD0|nr:hypothetical protein [Tolypothrix sp. NIES-4075]
MLYLLVPTHCMGMQILGLLPQPSNFDECSIAFPSLVKYISKPHPQPLSASSERGDKAQLYRGEVIAVPQLLGKRYKHFSA